MSAGFPNFIRNTNEYFSNYKVDFIILEWLFASLFHECTSTVSESNEKFVKSLIKKLAIFTNHKLKLKFFGALGISGFFQIKGKVKQQLRIIYEDKNYEFTRSVVIIWT